MKNELLYLLRTEPKARERKNKDRACVYVLLKHFESLNNVPKDVLIRFVQEYATLDRQWRKLLQDNVGLRGVDYETKKMLSQKKQIELGYEGGANVRLKNV